MIVELNNSGYHLRQPERVWCRPEFTGTGYNDGDEVEQRIHSFIEQARDLSVLSTELRTHCTDWPSLYHLSPSRSNILRPFESRLAGAEVLEIGAGCGAITRYLGESGARVVALEGSLRRAAIARSRCRELDNVTVVADLFDAFDGPWKFDVVTLIGVLEYATIYGQGADPALAMLQRARQWLKPDGRLIVAIENKLGLKYFAGAPEDHGAGPMYGVEGRYRKGEPATYGRMDLQRMLAGAGFSSTLFWGAFPDYKLPKVLISEDGFANPSFDAATLVSQGVANDLQMPAAPHFSLQRAYPELISNGLGMDLANSFLVVAELGQPLESPALAYHFNASRRPSFCKLTTFVTEPNGGIAVLTQPLDAARALENGDVDGPLIHEMEPRSPYLNGRLLSDVFLQIVTTDRWKLDGINAFMDTYLQAVAELVRAADGSSASGGPALSMVAELPGWCLDVIPQNIVETCSGTYALIDREWQCTTSLTMPMLIFRALYGLSAAVHPVNRPADEGLVTWGDLLQAVMARYGLPRDQNVLSDLAQQETILQQYIRGYAVETSVQQWFNYPLVRDDPGAISKLEQKVERLETALQHARTDAIVLHKKHADEVSRLETLLEGRQVELEMLQRQVLQLAGSLSWRLTAPVRQAGAIVLRARHSGHPVSRGLARLGIPAFQTARRLVSLLFSGRRQANTESVQRQDACTDGTGPRSPYDEYVETQRLQLEARRERYRLSIERFKNRPLISLVVPVYNPSLEGLRRCVTSVMRQIYPDWELCLVDDCSTREDIRIFLREFAASDSRVKCLIRDRNGHIAAATNDGIAMASGAYLAFLDHDDELTEDALYHVAERIDAYPDVDLLYTDQDKISNDNRRFEPFFKPDWSPALLCGVMYLGHLLVARTELVRAVGGCDPIFNGVQDYELALRLAGRASRIEHISRICYHWRASQGSIAHRIDAKPGIGPLQQRAVQAHIDRQGMPADAVLLNENHRVRIVPRNRADGPTISILICSKDAGELVSRCLDSLYGKTRYPNFEVLIADNGTTDPTALAAFARHPVRCISMPQAFHFAAFNNRLEEEAQGDYLLFLNNDTEILEPEWLSHLLLYAQQPDVAAVGPLLLYADRTVQHAGVILGPRGTADHAMRGFPENCDGYHGSLVCDREVSAVTAACMMLQREKFRQAGRFNELYRHHYEDLDLCLRLRVSGFRNIYVAGTKLLHHESKSRGRYYSYTDRMLLLDQWEPLVRSGDPYYNRNFDPARVDYAIWTEGLEP